MSFCLQIGSDRGHDFSKYIPDVKSLPGLRRGLPHRESQDPRLKKGVQIRVVAITGRLIDLYKARSSPPDGVHTVVSRRS